MRVFHKKAEKENGRASSNRRRNVVAGQGRKAAYRRMREVVREKCRGRKPLRRAKAWHCWVWLRELALETRVPRISQRPAALGVVEAAEEE
ncbi:unnamed protein product [Linum trigynum]|uniref:Uncharacterized protein n=1 Tax=Linum trigynum TaxID=586398 RepID=A0AAV2G015_9ROSI